MPVVEDKAGGDDPFANFNNDFGALGLGDADKKGADADKKDNAGGFDFGEDPGGGSGNDIFGNLGGAAAANPVASQPPAQ